MWLALAAVACVAGSAFVYDRALVAGGAGDRTRVPHPARADPHRWRRERPSLPNPSRFDDDSSQRLDGVMRDAWNAATSDDDLEPDDDTPADVTIVDSDDRSASRDDLTSTSRVPNPISIPGDGSGDDMSDAAILVVAYNRPDYLTRTLESLASVADLHLVSVYVSQDGDDVSVARVASGAAGRLGAPRTRGFRTGVVPERRSSATASPGTPTSRSTTSGRSTRCFSSAPLARHRGGGRHAVQSRFRVVFRRTADAPAPRPEPVVRVQLERQRSRADAKDPLALRRAGYFPDWVG